MKGSVFRSGQQWWLLCSVRSPINLYFIPELFCFLILSIFLRAPHWETREAFLYLRLPIIPQPVCGRMQGNLLVLFSTPLVTAQCARWRGSSAYTCARFSRRLTWPFRDCLHLQNCDEFQVRAQSRDKQVEERMLSHRQDDNNRHATRHQVSAVLITCQRAALANLSGIALPLTLSCAVSLTNLSGLLACKD